MRKLLINQSCRTIKPRLLTLLMTVLLLPLGVFADDYNISVGNIQVTTENASDVLGDGTVSFAVTNGPTGGDIYTLTLNNAKLDAASIQSSYELLYVRLIGQSSIIVDGESAPFQFTGVGGAAAPHIVFESSQADDGELIIDGNFTRDSNETSHQVTLSMGTYEVSNTFDTGDSSTTYGDWIIDTPYDEELEKFLTRIYYNPHYGITVGNYEVTKFNKDMITSMSGSDITYTPDDGILHIPSNSSFSETTVTSHIEELKVALNGECYLKAISFSYDQSFNVSTGTLTIMIDPASDFPYNKLTLGSGQERVFNDFTSVAIAEPLMQIAPAYQVDDLATDYLAYAEFGDCYGVSIGTTDEEYQRAQVTVYNFEDVLGDGTIYFNPTDTILTLNNAHIEGMSEGLLTTYNHLTIHLIGQNTMNSPETGIILSSSDYTSFISFTTDPDNPGSLTYTGSGELIDPASASFENGLALSTTANGSMVGYFQSYNLWVMGNRVTSVNKENVLGDANATVRFNPTTNTLTLYGATIETTDSTSAVRCALPSLTVDLRGNNKMKFAQGFISMNQAATVPLTFTTSESNPGQLSWEYFDAGLGAPVFSTSFNVSCSSPLRAFNESDMLISKAAAVNYGLMIGDTQVTSVNCTDVLGDGTVKYIDDSHVLVLDNASLSQTITSSLTGGLTIYLLGDNTISGAGPLIVSSVTDAPLTFIASDTEPGQLTLIKTVDWISGFAEPTVPADYATTIDGNTKIIARVVPITPIVAETGNGEQPSVEVETADLRYEIYGLEDEAQLNIVVNNVLYTIKAGDFNPSDTYEADDPDGVNLTEVPANMDAVLSQTPGTDAYANAFKGLTIEVPAGTGVVTVTGEVGEGAKLAVKIGSHEPVLFPNDDITEVKLTEPLVIPYAVSENTFVYVYLYQTSPAPARGDAPHRGKVLTGHVKVTSLGASSSSIVNSSSYSSQSNDVSARVVAYDLPESAYVASGKGIEMSTVEIDEAALARGGYNAPRRAIVTRQITELGANVFDKVAKTGIRYVDLSGTALKDITVSREGGIFKGFGDNVIIYLPEANDNGGEDNVVIDDVCSQFTLADDLGFRAPRNFTATKATLNRTFVAGQTSTVFLPFALSAAQADALGTFHTFKEIVDGDAVFNDASTTGTEANTPYIFKPTATKVDVDNVSVVGLNASDATVGNMIGTYEKITWDAEQSNIYGFAATAEGTVSAGQFVRVNAGAWLPPFRAYLQVDVAPSRLNVVIEGEETQGISSLTSSPSRGGDGGIYTLSGQRVSQPNKGLYIQNGKKIIVK